MKKLALTLALVAPLAAAQDWMPTSFDHTEVSPGIYYLTGVSGQMPVGATGLLVGDEYNWGFITTEVMTRTLIRSLTTD
ncbi:MAG: hypothetical protein HOH37_00800 [Gammaproteobacteria bacterium]|jgi:hypothetical protein|nr:hypothetical protein [Gammaproteobacteria bacterium]